MMIIDQARDAHRRLISMNEKTFTYLVYPTKSDGYGGTIPDRSKTPTTKTEYGRIAHAQGSVQGPESVNTGSDTGFSKFLDLYHTSEVVNGDEITMSDGEKWRIGPVDRLEVCGELFGKRAWLVKVT